MISDRVHIIYIYTHYLCIYSKHVGLEWAQSRCWKTTQEAEETISVVREMKTFSSFLRVLQRNRSNCVYIYGGGEIIRNLDYIIREAGKSQELQNKLAIWRPRRTDGLVLVQAWRTENLDSQWFHPVWRLAFWGIQEEPMFQLAFEVRKKKTDVPIQRPSGKRNSLLFVGGLALLFYSGFQLIGWGLPT